MENLFLNALLKKDLEITYNISVILWHKLCQFDFHRKKCIIHLVKLDELIPNIGIRYVKTASKNLRYFRTLRGRHSANKRFWGIRSRFLSAARRALQDVLYTFFDENQIDISYFELQNIVVHRKYFMNVITSWYNN